MQATNFDDRRAARMGRLITFSRIVAEYSVRSLSSLRHVRSGAARTVISQHGTAGPFRISRGSSTVGRKVPHTEEANRHARCGC